MPLTCECSPGEVRWFYEPPDDYELFKERRRKRCSSCGDLIELGMPTAKFRRWRWAKSGVEQRIYPEGTEFYLAPMFLCERCADLYFSFMELGYACVAPDENMVELAKEYAETRAA